jgi:hypothetical protein
MDAADSQQPTSGRDGTMTEWAVRELAPIVSSVASKEDANVH